MYQANAEHDGYIPVTLNPAKFEIRWETELSTIGIPANPVAAADGMVFASLFSDPNDGSDSFFCLDAKDGSIRWSKAYGYVHSVNPPAYTNNRVYIQINNHYDTHLYEYLASSGDMLVDAPISAQWARYYAPTIHSGRVFINGGYYGGMYSFDFSKDPPQQWFLALNRYDKWTPAVDDRFVYAYTGEYSPKVSILDIDTGVEQTIIPDTNFSWDGWSMNLAPVLGGMNDLLAIQAGRLISFDIAEHSIRYEIAGGFSGQVSVRQGVVYAINNQVLEAREQLTGMLLWSWAPPSDWRLNGPLIITDSHVFVNADSLWGTVSQAIHAIDLVSHQSVWSHPIAGHLAWSEGILLVAGDDGLLTAFGPPVLFADDFESNDISAWSASSP